jgi:hypothetical protein
MSSQFPGDIEGLKVRDYTRIDKEGQKIDYKNEVTYEIGRLDIYNGEPGRYVTFTTSEVARSSINT